MSEQNLQPAGTFKAKISNYGLKTSQGGDLMAVAIFDYTAGDHRYSVFWTGMFKDASMAGKEASYAITMKTLATMGFDFAKHADILILAKGPEGGALDMEKELTIKVAHEANPKDGKMYAKVKFVNDGGIKDALSYETAMQTFRGVNALMAQFKKNNPQLCKAKAAAVGNSATQAVELDNIPF